MQNRTLKTLAVVAQKGGVGKTTLAVNLAILAVKDGLRVALVDTDPQASAAGWWKTRQADDLVMIERDAAMLPDIQKMAQAEGFDLLIVDTRPSVEGETLRAAKAATAAIIPTRPGILDLRAIASTANVIRSADCPACIVLNQCPPPRGVGEATLTAEAREAANSIGLPVAPPACSSLVAYSYALNDGRAVCEYEPDGKADLELRALWRYLRKAYLDG